MRDIPFHASIASIAAALVWALPAQGADVPRTLTGSAKPAAVAPGTALPPSQRVPGNGGVRRIDAAASAASGAASSRNVQTTIEDGRTATRNAHDRHETDAARTQDD